ncbi:MAG: hypothetical protein WCF84_25095 [Anaerolineae bacterium]
MRVNEFLRLVAETSRAQLPQRLRRFNGRSRFTLIQIYYDKRTLHYEVWVRGKERLLEIGLHFESDRETNARLLDYFSARAFELKAELGDQIEVEQWTASWTRVHQLMPYEQLDAATASAVGERLAKMIEVLQPMLERFKAGDRVKPKDRS